MSARYLVSLKLELIRLVTGHDGAAPNIHEALIAGTFDAAARHVGTKPLIANVRNYADPEPRSHH